MKLRINSHSMHAIAASGLFLSPAAAQVPEQWKQSISAPADGMQSGAMLGLSMPLDGSYLVAGVPFDDTGALDSSVVKMFDTVSGALLFVLPNPSPEFVKTTVILHSHQGCGILVSLVPAPQDPSHPPMGWDQQTFHYQLSGRSTPP